MFYTVYKVTNQINGKIYIGCHKTKDLDDDYMGSGKYLARAKEKHGIENFKKEILFVFDNPEQMFAKEAEIVNEDFLAEENTYNLNVGGFGGWDYINSNDAIRKEKNSRARKSTDKVLEEKYGQNWRRILVDKCREGYTENSYKRKNETRKRNGIKSDASFMNTPESISKRNMTLRSRQHQKGDKNSQFGTVWVCHATEGAKKIKSTEIDSFLQSGWRKGRKYK